MSNERTTVARPLIRYSMTGLVLAGAGLLAPVRAELLLGIPKKASEPVNSAKRDESAVVASDGLTMYFSSMRAGGRRLWQVTRDDVNSAWQSPQRIDAISGNVTASTVSADGLELYFADGWGPFFGSDIWVSKRSSVEHEWGTPARVSTVNSSQYDDAPYLSPDGLSLYFSSNRPGGFGANDLYVAHRESRDGDWGEPQNLGPHTNGPHNDWMGSVWPDGKMLFFDSDRPGIGNYVVSRTSSGEEFTNAAFFPRSINVSADAWRMTPSPDGSTLYYTVGHGQQADIWEVPVQPFESISLRGNGDRYVQNFDEGLGMDGTVTETILPTGWSTSQNGVLFENATTAAFPLTGSITSRSTPTFNAGAQDDPDRTLAIGVSNESDDQLIQLLANVTDVDARGLQLTFDIETWDVGRRRRDDPGEAAFQVAIEVDRGDGFAPLLDLGTVTTGVGLVPPETDYLDGNATANRTTFHSGLQHVNLPAGSQLRVRWKVPTEAAAAGWVYGLDNVEFSLFDDLIVGDFDDNGMLDVVDVHQLVGEIAAQTHSSRFDLTGDNVVDHADLTTWVHDLKQTWFGDANLDREFGSGDLIEVFQAGEYEDTVPMNSNWSTGDWNGDAEFDSSDLVLAFQEGGYELGPRAVVVAVPEPAGAVLLTTSLLGLAVLRRRRGMLAKCRVHSVTAAAP